jgi:hypothetical protein
VLLDPPICRTLLYHQFVDADLEAGAFERKPFRD